MGVFRPGFQLVQLLRRPFPWSKTPAGGNVAITPATISATSTFSGAVTKLDDVSGAFNATTTFSGTVTVQKKIAGAFNATTTFSGTVTKRDDVSGSFTATTTFSGSVARLIRVAGSFNATTTFAGAVAGGSSSGLTVFQQDQTPTYVPTHF
jgi:hypothetical protein